MTRNQSLVLISLTLYQAKAVNLLEIGVNANYMHYDNTETSRTLKKTYGASIAYRFLAFSSIELAYARDWVRQTDRNHVADLTVTSIGDRYTISWIQNLTEEQSTFQPYLKAGIGYVDRIQRYEFNYGDFHYAEDSRGYGATAITGAGLRMFMAQRFALKAEGNVLWTGVSGSPTRHYIYSGGLSWFY